MKIDDTTFFYAFDKNLNPVETVNSGDTITFSTKDCFSNQINTASDFQNLDWNNVNPATGPVAVKGASKGDILKVEILKIDIKDKGVMCVAPGAGVLGDMVKEAKARVFDIQNGFVNFNEKIKVPLNKMIGVIGVAPEGDAVPNGTPSSHGGNMDNKVITEGATLYLPVFHEGALFGLGDLHGAMGDGEVGVSGLEVCGEVAVRISVIKGKTITDPMLEDKTDFYTIVSSETMENALKRAVSNMEKYLSEKIGLEFSDAVMLASMAGNAEIAQVVDPLVTVRFRMPKNIFVNFEELF